MHTPVVVNGDLADDVAAALRGAATTAWDTETTGLDWRTDRLATCQVFAPEVGVFVVRLVDTPPRNLASLLADEDVEKLFHHAPFDLRFLVRAWGVQPVRVRCTKVASKLLDPAVDNRDHSLSALVGRHLGVDLPKGPVRTSDWTTAELAAEQVEYAANDVLHLPALHAVLERRLIGAGSGELYEACCRFLPARVELELQDYPDVFAY